LPDRPARADRPVEDLFGRERVEVEARDLPPDRRAEVDVVAAVELRRQPGLEADLGRAELPRLAGAPHDLRHRQEVALLRAVVPAERAERAVLDAHVGEIDVAVDHERDEVARLPAAHLVGDEPERVEVAPGERGEEIGLLHRELAAVERTPEDLAAAGRGPVEGGGETTSVASGHTAPSRARRRRRAPPPAPAAARRRTPSAGRTRDTPPGARAARSRPRRSGGGGRR